MSKAELRRSSTQVKSLALARAKAKTTLVHGSIVKTDIEVEVLLRLISVSIPREEPSRWNRPHNVLTDYDIHHHGLVQHYSSRSKYVKPNLHNDSLFTLDNRLTQQNLLRSRRTERTQGSDRYRLANCPIRSVRCTTW